MTILSIICKRSLRPVYLSNDLFSLFYMAGINSTDIINYKKDGFDGEKYIRIQKERILDRIANFSGGRLYLEI